MSNKGLKVLVVGCGLIAKHWIPYTLEREDLTIVGLVDINVENALDAMERYRFKCPYFSDLYEALEITKPDLIYDLTYVTVHSQIVTKALKFGCHVFGEKPMTLTREEAQIMIKTADETGKTYSMMQNRRYQKPVQALRDVVRSGELGEIWMISADIFVPEDLCSIRNTLEKPMLQDNAIHSFDQARFITGQDPVTVYCHSYNPTNSKYKGDAAGSCIFEMSRGAVFVYNCVMGGEGLYTSWESNWRIIGNKGSVVWDGFSQPYGEVRQDNKQDREFIKIQPKSDWAGRDQHYGCLDEMFSSLSAGKRSETDCHDNYKSISMAFSAIDSAREGCRIDVY